MILTIELSAKQQAALKAQARAEGVSEAGFVRKVLEQVLEPALMPGLEEETTPGQPRQPLSARIRDLWTDMPDEVRAEYPEGGAYQIDHHVYGVPKR